MSIFDIINAKKYWISIKSELNAAQSFTSIAKFFKTKSYAFLASGSFSRKIVLELEVGTSSVISSSLFFLLGFGFHPSEQVTVGQRGSHRDKFRTHFGNTMISSTNVIVI